MRKTKIVATIGPACDTADKIEEMIEAGVDVFRFNMKHNTIEWHSERMEVVESVCEKTGRHVAMLLDLQGPEVRIDDVPKKWSKVSAGDEVRFSCPGTEGITLDHPEIFDDLKVGQRILADDGFLEFEVIKTGDRWVDVRVIEGGPVKERKTVNFPGMKLNFPTLVDKDIERLSLAARHHVDFVALSFVRSAEDIRVLRQELEKYKVESHIMAKIEHPDAIENFSEVVDEADCVVVARGDLGVEYPLEEVPNLQKFIIRKCREEGKPVVIATQMLESMIEKPRPTRAEVSDVANAVYDSTDALWLSGESAMGKYPVRAVKTMVKIAERAEKAMTQPDVEVRWERGGQTAAVVASAVKLMECGYRGVCDIDAFVVLTETGKTVDYLSRMRPELPIFALTNSNKTRDQLKLSWGVEPIYFEYDKNEYINVNAMVHMLAAKKLVKKGRKVIMIYGELWGTPGLTSVIRVQEVIGSDEK
ncbi:pyruvate kinase [Pseudomonadota bacterium]